MCIFCKIINNEISAHKVYEDEYSLAFLDIKPVNAGHCLVIPKKHYQNIEEIGEEDLKHLIVAVKKVGSILKNKLSVSGYNVITNNDPVAGQIIPHIHFHVIPRIKNDGNNNWKQRDYNPGEVEEILNKINNKGL